MRGTLKGVVTRQQTKDGPGAKVRIEMEDGLEATLWIMEKFRNYWAWQPYLDGTYIVDGLAWKDERRRLINADSPFVILRSPTPPPSFQRKLESSQGSRPQTEDYYIPKTGIQTTLKGL